MGNLSNPEVADPTQLEQQKMTQPGSIIFDPETSLFQTEGGV